MPAAAVPERIGPYVIEATLGRGAMGVVYLARDTRIGRRVALKRIQLRSGGSGTSPTTLDFFRRLQREAEVCAALHHPNIVTLFDVGYEDSRISYLAMEYVAGESLSEVIRRYGPAGMPADLVARITSDVLRGLACAHAKGIVHRDIKPANVMIGHDETAKIADFGIARPQQSDMTIVGALMGTPNYMSPEQARGLPATPCSDLFAVGVMMFEMFTGTKPFAGGDVQSTIQNILHRSTPSIGALGGAHLSAYEEFIQRLTAKLGEERFPSAEAALGTLEQLRAGMPLTTTALPAASPVAVQSSLVVLVLRRSIPAMLFWSVIIAAGVAAITPVIVIRILTVETSTAQISRRQVEEFALKRAALRDADRLYRVGKYDESLTKYEAYLARYPYSTAAHDGAERSRAALEGRAPGTRRRSADKSRVDQLKRKLRRIFH